MVKSSASGRYINAPACMHWSRCMHVQWQVHGNFNPMTTTGMAMWPVVPRHPHHERLVLVAIRPIGIHPAPELHHAKRVRGTARQDDAQ